MTKITIIDRPCGWGKTTELFSDLKSTNGPFIIVVPLLSECERVVSECRSRDIPIVEAGEEDGTEFKSKTEHVRKLLSERRNIVCTHALYSMLGTLAAEMVPTIFGHQSALHCYSIFIDEVINPFDQYSAVKSNDFRKVYLGEELVTIQQDGLVLPTAKWDGLFDGGVQTYDRQFYTKCRASSLYYINDNLFILTVPLELLTKPRAVTVLTFQCRGSFFYHYVRKLIDQGIDIDLLVDELAPEKLEAWKKDVREALTISTIPSLEKFSFTHNGQTKFKNSTERRTNGKRIGTALRKFKERDPMFKTVPHNATILTCAKCNWYQTGEKPIASFWSSDSRMFGRWTREGVGLPWFTSGVKWVANQTRGTNDYSDCSHAIYLYDQNPNPQVTSFLGWPYGSKEYYEFADSYALAELVQWLFRCQIRKGGYGLNEFGEEVSRGERLTTTVFIPSERMRGLLTNWLYHDCSASSTTVLNYSDELLFADVSEATLQNSV